MPARSSSYAHFSPSLLCSSYHFKFPKRPGGARSPSWEYVNQVASVIHERRHFHDWVGTPLGMNLFYHLQRIVNQYLVHLGPHVSDVSSLTLPICDQKDFISVSAANFARDYREQMAQYNWLMATVDLPEDYAAENSLSAFTLPNSRVNLPVLNLPELRFSVNDVVQPFRKSYIPFGGLQIIEALAFILEAMHLRHYCGPEYETKLNEVVLASPEGLNYAIVGGLVQVILGIFPLEATLNACLFALCTPGPQFDIEQHHPGWRFIHVLLELSEGDEYNIAAFSKAVNRLCRKKGWVHPREVLQQSKKYVQAQLRHNAKTPGTEDVNAVKAYNEMYYGYSDILVNYHLGTRLPRLPPLRIFGGH